MSGQFHRGVAVPHVTRSLPNIAPDGFVHFKPDNTWVIVHFGQTLEKVVNENKSWDDASNWTGLNLTINMPFSGTTGQSGNDKKQQDKINDYERKGTFDQNDYDRIINSPEYQQIKSSKNVYACNGCPPMAQSNSGVDVSGLSTANGWFGTAVGFGEVSTLAGQGKYITSKGLIRYIDYSKLTANSTPYATAGKILKSWGRASAGIGVAIDSYSWWNNQLSGAKFALNLGVTAWGLGAGAAGMAVPGFVGGVIYFGIDTFYPGGWGGAMQNQSRINQNNKAINPSWQLWPGAMKQ